VAALRTSRLDIDRLLGSGTSLGHPFVSRVMLVYGDGNCQSVPRQEVLTKVAEKTAAKKGTKKSVRRSVS